MKRRTSLLLTLVMAVVCLLGPVASLPAMACGMGCCAESACNCGMKSQSPAMDMGLTPAAAMASFDPSLMAHLAQVSVSQPAAPETSFSPVSSPSDERSPKEKLYDAQSNHRL